MYWDTAINVTFTGIVIVFSMLVLLVLVLMIFGAITGLITKIANKKSEKIKKAELAKIVEDSAEVETVSNSSYEIVSSPTNDEQIVAVISAAVAMMYSGSAKKPVIKAIKKSGSRRSAWASAGIADNTKGF